MSKLVKVISSLLLILALIIIAGIILLFSFIDPNKFKTQIQNQIRSATNFDVEIKGQIHWSIYPTLGIEVENVIIKNPTAAAQQKLADVAQASVKAKLIPLFHGQVEIDAISLDAPTIYLVKDTTGRGNWVTNNKQNTDVKNEATSNNQKQKSEKRSLEVSIQSFKINNGKMSFRDLKKNQTINLSNIEFTTKNIAFSKNFPIDTSFKLEIPQQNIHSSVAFKSLVNVDKQLKNYELNDIYLEFDQSTLRGKLTFNDNRNAVAFKFDVDEINLDRYLTTSNKNQKVAESNTLINENLLASADNNLKGIRIRSKTMPNVSGSLQIQKLITNNIKITDIKAIINSPRTNVIKIAPFTARTYEGEINSSITLDMAPSSPLWHVITSGTNLQVAPMLKDLANKESLTGTFSLTSDVTTKGTSKDELIRNLTGNAKFNLKNGALKNIDINQALIIASQIFNKQIPSATPSSSQTDFANFAMTADFQNGVMTTNDLTLSSPILLVSGKGTANLISEAIHFDLLATVLGVNLGSKVKQLQQILGGIPLQVTGTFSNYHIRPDEQAIMNAAAKELIEQQKDKVQKKVDKFLEKNSEKIGDKLKGLLNH